MDSKIDVVIPTRDELNIRPNLLRVLRKASWVNRIIVEKSSPLSIARKNGALKCTTDWIVFFDDDVEIDEGWFEAAASKIRDGVVAVSGTFDEQNKHVGAFIKYTFTLCDPATIETANICNTLILRKIFADYQPPLIFAGEDTFLYKYVTGKGLWVHFHPSHAKHYGVIKGLATHFQEGTNIRKYGALTKKQFIRNLYHRTFRSVMAMRYSGTVVTPLFYWMGNVGLVCGYVWGIFS